MPKTMWTAKRRAVLTKRLEPTAYPTGERWDTDLSPVQVRHLSAQERHRRSLTALIRKVAILQGVSGSLTKLLDEPFIPDERKALREWRDPSRGLWSWSDVKLDNPNNQKNQTIIDAFYTALMDIDKLKKGKQSSLRREITEKNAIIERLELRNAELLEVIRKLRGE